MQPVLEALPNNDSSTDEEGDMRDFLERQARLDAQVNARDLEVPRGANGLIAGAVPFGDTFVSLTTAFGNRIPEVTARIVLEAMAAFSPILRTSSVHLRTPRCIEPRRFVFYALDVPMVVVSADGFIH